MGSSSSRPEDVYKRQEGERKYGAGGTEMPYIYSTDGMGGYLPNPNYAPEWSGGRNPATGAMPKPQITATWSGYPDGPISHPEGQLGNPHHPYVGPPPQMHVQGQYQYHHQQQQQQQQGPSQQYYRPQQYNMHPQRQQAPQQQPQHHNWCPQQQQHGRPQQSNNPYRR